MGAGLSSFAFRLRGSGMRRYSFGIPGRDGWSKFFLSLEIASFARFFRHVYLEFVLCSRKEIAELVGEKLFATLVGLLSQYGTYR
jgi:hypothetical protein